MNASDRAHPSHIWKLVGVTADGCLEAHCKNCGIDEYDFERSREKCKGKKVDNRD